MSNSLVFRINCPELPMDEKIENGKAQEKMSGVRSSVHHTGKMLDPHPEGCHPPNSHDSVHPHED